MSEYNMKKIAIILGLLLMATPAMADVISCANYSADSTIAHFNTCKNKIIDEFNGSTDGGTDGATKNIGADTLGEIDMGDDINPRIRDNELLGVGVDSTTASTAVRIEGLQPATSVNLISDISAGTAYVNGYRIAKAATSKTYTASKDTYVDLSQDEAYTFSEVATGGAAPAVATNSIRLAKVVTDGDNITGVTDLSATTIPGLVTPTNFRTGIMVSRDSANPATKILVTVGDVEMNGAIVTLTAEETLTVTGVDGDWASGSDDSDANTMNYVGIDSSANVKLLDSDEGPSHSNYDVSLTTPKLRYVTASTVVYRVLGWFYLNGSTQITSSAVGNIKEADVHNAIVSYDYADAAIAGITSATAAYVDIGSLNYYSSGGPVLVSAVVSGDTSTGMGWHYTIFNGETGNEVTPNGVTDHSPNEGEYLTTFVGIDNDRSQSIKNYILRGKNRDAGNNYIRGTILTATEQ